MIDRCLLSFMMIVCLAGLPVVACAGEDDGRLEIYWIDVEGGAATLIVTPAGESILIDTGLPQKRFIDRMQDAIIHEAGVQRLHHLVISHYDKDHYGGAADLAARIPVGTLYDNGKFTDMRRQPDESYWSLPCRKRVVVNPGDEFPLLQRGEAKATAFRLKCIATRQQFIRPPNGAVSEVQCAKIEQRDPDPSENANSMVLMLEFGDFRFYNATDLTWNLESKLICPHNLVGQADVYQVTHHGLDRSNHPMVMGTLKPTISVMNNGRTKGCAAEVFENLKKTPSIKAMYQMHRNRRPDGRTYNTSDEFIANREDGESGNIIKLSVASDGKSYEVTIPAKGHRATYQTKGH